jgi:hypothetical protein
MADIFRESWESNVKILTHSKSTKIYIKLQDPHAILGDISHVIYKLSTIEDKTAQKICRDAATGS